MRLSLNDLCVFFFQLYGELFPAVAFYNIGQEIEILADGFKTTCPQEGIPVSPCRLNLDELSLLNELVLSIYHRQPLSHRLTHMLVDQCNQWSAASFVRYRAVSGKDVFLSKESPLLKRCVLFMYLYVLLSLAVDKVNISSI